MKWVILLHDLDLVKNMILLYRELESEKVEEVDRYFKTKMNVTTSFERDLGIKMSLIAWCKHLAMEKDKKRSALPYILYCK